MHSAPTDIQGFLPRSRPSGWLPTYVCASSPDVLVSDRVMIRHRELSFWKGGLCAIAVSAAVLLCGCVLGPPSADVMFGGVSRSVGAPTQPGSPIGYDGIYVGVAVAEEYGINICPSPMPISNFQVAGNILRFGGFSGAVAFDGSVLLPFAGMWLVGGFQGPMFFGYVDAGASSTQLYGCFYAISVRRLGD
jgi:hypothetical protein